MMYELYFYSGVFMIFSPLTQNTRNRSDLRAEYKEAKAYGVIRLGSSCFFFRRGFRVYYITYTEITRAFRRVMLIPTGTKRGDMKLETFVICDAKGELAQIQIPGVEAARSLLEEMKAKAPHAEFTGPEKEK